MKKFNRKFYNKIKKITNNFTKWEDYKPINQITYYKNRFSNIELIDNFIKTRIRNGESNLEQLITTFKQQFKSTRK